MNLQLRHCLLIFNHFQGKPSESAFEGFEDSVPFIQTSNFVKVCEFCGIETETFIDNAKFYEHYQRHKNELHECDQCEKTFLTKRLLKCHKGNVHRSNLTCSCCAKASITYN